MKQMILIVEDEEGLRESLRELLEEEGYPVTAASNGREALGWLTSGGNPGVILLDLIMPVMGGVELYAALQEHERLARIPVLITTSDPSRAPTGTLILKKPFQLSRLLQLIERLVTDSE